MVEQFLNAHDGPQHGEDSDADRGNNGIEDDILLSALNEFPFHREVAAHNVRLHYRVDEPARALTGTLQLKDDNSE